jgi:hypothetical protein
MQPPLPKIAALRRTTATRPSKSVGISTTSEQRWTEFLWIAVVVGFRLEQLVSDGYRDELCCCVPDGHDYLIIDVANEAFIVSTL